MNFVPYISKTEIDEICARLGKQISEDYKSTNLIVIVVLKGSIVFAADLIRKIQSPVQIDFVRLSSYSGTKSTGSINLSKDLSLDIKDQHVLVVEDILDTGLTMSYFKQHLMTLSPRSVKICAFLDKPSRRQVPLEGDYIGKQIEDHFVVGYGLDYNEKYRNIPEILYLK